MKELRIPYAIVEGEMVSAEKAQKRNDYRCPDCNERLILRVPINGNDLRYHSGKLKSFRVLSKKDTRNMGHIKVSALIF